jgi:YVTN family beta-propeller protein
VYVALEGSGEIAVINAVTKKVVRKIDLSEMKNGKRINYMPHNVQVAPNDKSVWVTTAATEKKRTMSFQIIPVVNADEGSVRDMVDADDQIHPQIRSPRGLTSVAVFGFHMLR